MNIGDRVNHPTYGLGVIVDFVGRYSTIIGVRFDLPNQSFHNCIGRCEDFHGWYCGRDLLSLVWGSKEAYEDALI